MRKKKHEQGKLQGPAWSSVLLHALLIITALGLVLDLVFRNVLGTSLCPTEACAIVGDYVRIGESNLVFTGLVFFLVLWLVYFLARRFNRTWLWGSATLLLMGGLAFDGGLMGFQFAVVQQSCDLCIAVAAALLLALVLFAVVRRQAFLVLLGLAVWLGGGAVGAMIDQPSQPSSSAAGVNHRLEDIEVIRWSGPDADQWPRFYFFFSLHCPHCSEVLIRLALEEETPGRFTWDFVPLDTDPKDLQRIAALQAMDLKDKNPFYEILLMEQTRGVPEAEVPESLKKAIHEARAYFQTRGFRGVPVTVVQQGPGEKTVLVGADNALRFFYREGIVSDPAEMRD